MTGLAEHNFGRLEVFHGVWAGLRTRDLFSVVAIYSPLSQARLADGRAARIRTLRIKRRAAGRAEGKKSIAERLICVLSGPEEAPAVDPSQNSQRGTRGSRKRESREPLRAVR